MNLRSKPTGNQVWVVTNEDALLEWRRFYDLLKPEINDIDIQFRDQYIGTVELLLDKLVCAGWLEEERGQIRVLNNVCIHKAQKMCGNKEKLSATGLARLRCTEEVRRACKVGGGGFYQQRYSTPMLVQYVIIRKIGQLRGVSR